MADSTVTVKIGIIFTFPHAVSGYRWGCPIL